MKKTIDSIRAEHEFQLSGLALGRPAPADALLQIAGNALEVAEAVQEDCDINIRNMAANLATCEEEKESLVTESRDFLKKLALIHSQLGHTRLTDEKRESLLKEVKEATEAFEKAVKAAE